MPINSINITVATGATTSPSTVTARERLPEGGILRAASARHISGGGGPMHVSIVVFHGTTLLELEGTQGWIRGGTGLGGGKAWTGEIKLEDPNWFISLSSENNTGAEVTMQLTWEVDVPDVPEEPEES